LLIGREDGALEAEQGQRYGALMRAALVAIFSREHPGQRRQLGLDQWPLPRHFSDVSHGFTPLATAEPAWAHRAAR
jgi:hypothetical protein